MISGVSVGTPGTLATWEKALERWGSTSLGKALRPAAKLAERGFVVDTTFNEQTTANLQKAIEDLDHARAHAGKDVKSNLDTAIDRMKDVATDFRKRAEDEAGDWQKTIENTTEDMRRELAGRACPIIGAVQLPRPRSRRATRARLLRIITDGAPRRVRAGRVPVGGAS